MRRNLTPLALVVGCAIAALRVAQSQTPAAASGAGMPPDVAGIRPGMSAQEAYNALKAHNPRAPISIGQTHIPELTNKPIPLYMTLGGPSNDEPEIITVALTLPPTKQQVWGIIRQIQYQQDQEILSNTAENGLRQKYGQPWAEHLSIGRDFWAFDEQGRPVVETPALRTSNCAAATVFDLPIAGRSTPMYDVGVPVPIIPQSNNPCALMISVKSQLGGGSRNDTVRQITVSLADNPLVMRSWQAFQASMANAGAAREKKEQQDLQKRPAPKF